MQVGLLKNSCQLALKELRHWMAPEKVFGITNVLLMELICSSFLFPECGLHYARVWQVKTSITIFPSSAAIVPEPLGVVLIISAWNYPYCTSVSICVLVHSQP